VYPSKGTQDAVTRAGAVLAKATAVCERARQARAAADRALARSRATSAPSPHELMPLDMAVSTVFRRVYSERFLVGCGRGDGHLDGLAYMMASLVPVWVYKQDGSGIRILTKGELAAGLFKGGAKEMYFLDGRPTLTALAVSVHAIEATRKAFAASQFEY
jgi:hypothetical protein